MNVWEEEDVLENMENKKGSNGCAKNVPTSYPGRWEGNFPKKGRGGPGDIDALGAL